MTGRRPPPDAADRRRGRPVDVYAANALDPPDLDHARATLVAGRVASSLDVPPRDARAVEVPAGHLVVIRCVDGPQVGDLNLWNARDLDERFYSGKTRALHGTHVTTGDRLWSTFPRLRPLATIVDDTLDWYGRDADGAGVHDVIGTRCDPYTHRLLTGTDYHRCCHSNLTRALAEARDLSLDEAERHIHDVLNVFMCTGFSATGRYFMKASPVRPGDHLALLAEIDLLVALSACPGGDCGAEHSSDRVECHPLRLDILPPLPGADHDPPAISQYDRSHKA